MTLPGRFTERSCSSSSPGVPAGDTAARRRSGARARSRMAVIGPATSLGPAWGHSGFFPGYATEMLYFPNSEVAAAAQLKETEPTREASWRC